MKVEINTEEGLINVFVDNTDYIDLLETLDLFDSEQWDDFDIVINGEKKQSSFIDLIYSGTTLK